MLCFEVEVVAAIRSKIFDIVLKRYPPQTEGDNDASDHRLRIIARIVKVYPEADITDEEVRQLAEAERPKVTRQEPAPTNVVRHPTLKTGDAAPSVSPPKSKRASRNAIRFLLEKFDEIELSAQSTYLTKNLIPARGIVIIWGPPKCGKSFWVLDVMAHVALGWNYRGQRVTQGSVVYIALEGHAGYNQRIEAYRRKKLNGGKIPDFHVLRTSLDLIGDVKEIIANIRAQCVNPAAIVIDTLARSIPGSESFDRDIAAYIKAAEALGEAFECVVPIIHHCGYDDSRMRGWSGLAGALDVEISVRNDANGVVIASVESAEDMADGLKIYSRLDPVALGVDQDGDQQYSCVAMPLDDAETKVVAASEAAKKKRKRDNAGVTALRAAYNEVAASEPGVMVEHNLAWPIGRVREGFAKQYVVARRGDAALDNPKKKQDAIRKAFDRANDIVVKRHEYGTRVHEGVELLWLIEHPRRSGHRDRLRLMDRFGHP